MVDFSFFYCTVLILVFVNVFLLQLNLFSVLKKEPVADLGGDASPPTSLKVTILAEKSASISNNSAPFRDASPPTSLNPTNPAEKSLLILVKTFFFWRPPDFGRKKRLNFRFRPKNHSQFR